MRAVLPAALLALSAATAQPLPLKVDGQTTLLVKSLPFTVTAPPGADVYTWGVPPGVEASPADNVLAVTKAADGVHKFTVATTTLVVDFDARTTRREKAAGETTVQVGLAPQPPPPVPPVPPAPVSDKVYVALIRDPSSLTVQQATLLGDTPFWDSLKARGHEWDSYSNLSPEVERLKYGEIARSLQTGTTFSPVMIVLDARTGKVLDKRLLPADKAAVLEILKGVAK